MIAVTVPHFKRLPSGKWRSEPEKTIPEVTDREGFLEILDEVNDFFPDRSPWEISQLYFKPVCVTALIDLELDMILGWETAADLYGVMPHPGGYLDQPNRLTQLFEEIRASKNYYERSVHEKIEADIKKKGGGSPS